MPQPLPPDDGDAFALLHGQIDAFQNFKTAEGLSQVIHLDQAYCEMFPSSDFIISDEAGTTIVNAPVRNGVDTTVPAG